MTEDLLKAVETQQKEILFKKKYYMVVIVVSYQKEFKQVSTDASFLGGIHITLLH